MITYVTEIISHFNCTICGKWWSVSEFKSSEYVWCPHCAKGDKPVRRDSAAPLPSPPQQ